MAAEDLKVLDPDDVIVIIGVCLHQVQEDFDFDSRLMLKSLFIPDNLDRDKRLCLVIQALERLAETSAPEEAHHFIPVRQMVLHHHLIVAPLIIKAIIILVVMA